MAAYDYRCRTCETTFEVRRGVTEDSAAVACPAGHEDVARVWSAVSVGGLAAVTAGVGSGSQAQAGGCCGGGCCS